MQTKNKQCKSAIIIIVCINKYILVHPKFIQNLFILFLKVSVVSADTCVTISGKLFHICTCLGAELNSLIKFNHSDISDLLILVASQPIDEVDKVEGPRGARHLRVFINIFLLAHCAQNSHTLLSSVSI